MCQEVYRQQAEMYKTQPNKIADRIVSLTQPHIRPLVRGKAGKTTEFGAKLSSSSFEGYVSHIPHPKCHMGCGGLNLPQQW